MQTLSNKRTVWNIRSGNLLSRISDYFGGLVDYWRCYQCGIAVNTKQYEEFDKLCIVCAEADN